MLTRYSKRKMSKKINFDRALPSSSSAATMVTTSPKAPLGPQPKDDCNLHPQNAVRCNPAHSGLPTEVHLAPSFGTENIPSCSVEPGSPVCEKASMPPFEDPFHYQDQHCRKKDAQYGHWQNEVIPALIQPYLDILRHTDHMRLPFPEAHLSKCQCVRRQLKVLGVSWTSEQALHKFHYFAYHPGRCGDNVS